jgi:hypothetical protein
MCSSTRSTQCGGAASMSRRPSRPTCAPAVSGSGRQARRRLQGMAPNQRRRQPMCLRDQHLWQAHRRRSRSGQQGMLHQPERGQAAGRKRQRQWSLPVCPVVLPPPAAALQEAAAPAAASRVCCWPMGGSRGRIGGPQSRQFIPPWCSWHPALQQAHWKQAYRSRPGRWRHQCWRRRRRRPRLRYR